MSKLNQEELVEKLGGWIRRSRRDETPDNIIWHIDDESAHQDIVALIKKPEVTEEWIEEKAKELITMVANLYPYETNPGVIPKSKAKDFIRTFVKEIK